MWENLNLGKTAGLRDRRPARREQSVALCPQEPVGATTGPAAPRMIATPLCGFHIGICLIRRFAGRRPGRRRADRRIQVIGNAGDLAAELGLTRMFVILAFIIKMPVTYTGPARRNIHSMLAGRARLRWPAARKDAARSRGQLQFWHNSGNARLQDRKPLCVLGGDNQLKLGQGLPLVP